MYTVHSRGADFPFSLRFGLGPILVQINMQHSQAQPYGICTRVIYLTQFTYSVFKNTIKYPFYFDIQSLFNNSFILPELLLKDKCREKGGTLRHKTLINR